MGRRILYATVALLLLGFLVSYQESSAAPYFEGKVIKIIVGHDLMRIDAASSTGK